MNNTTINRIIKYAIITGLALIPFIPLYVANSLFFPFITGKAFVFRIIVEVVFALWFILVLREKGTSEFGTDRSVVPKINKMTVLVSLFTVIALAADLFGLNPLRSIWSNFERMEGWIIIVHLWAYFMVMSSVLNTKDNWRKFFNVFLSAGALVALYGIFQFFGLLETHQGERIDATLGNAEYMAIFMLINAYVSAYLAVSYYAIKHHLAWVYSVGFVVFSFVMFQTATRGTILAWIASILISCAIYVIFGRKEKGQTNKSRYYAGGVIVLFVALTVLFYFYKDAAWIQKNAVLGRLATISISDTTTQARAYIWPMAVKSTFKTPKNAIIGIGQENFNDVFNSNYNPEMWRHEQWFDRAHSVYLDWLVAGGLLGLLSYLALYLFSLIFIIKSDVSIAQKSVLIGLLAAYAMHNIFVFDNQTSYVVFFVFLAFVHSLSSGKTPSIFKNFNKHPSEDAITVRDYIYTPAIILALGCSIYFVNIRPIQANTDLIAGLRACQDTKTITVVPFQEALKLDQTMSDQEVREQFIGCAAQAVSNQQIDNKTRMDFYNLSKTEIENQIKTTPNDARIYIIAGSYFNSIRDFKSATPLLEKANILSPNKQSIIYELASNYLSVGKEKEAVDLMQKAYQSSPDNDTAKAGYVATLITAKMDDTASKLFANDTKVLNDPKVVNAYLYTKQYSKAISIYKSMLKDQPDSQEIYSALAYAYLLNGQDSQAIEILKTVGERFIQLKTQADALIKQIQEGKFKIQ